jgi:phthiodiolone/phenolphthiodiolone dimycocerosates ketoreductase
MSVQPGTFFRTTLPLDLSRLAELDDGRYHSMWLPDHMVSFWPDSIWTPEFTDLATTSHSPHRYLDAMAVAAAVGAKTERVGIATFVVDTVRRHPAMLAQSAITLDHICQGRFILGLGSGEMENCTPYGFDFERPVSRFEEALQVIRLLWDTDGPVDFEGRFYQLHHARLDIEPYGGRTPKLWVGCSGPRMLGIAGRWAEGWWPVGNFTPEDYAAQLGRVRQSAEAAGRDPMAITAAATVVCLIGEDDEIAEMVQAPLVKAYMLQMRADFLKKFGFDHPLGPGWKGIHDFDPRELTREKIIDFLGKVDTKALLAALPHGTPKRMAQIMKGYLDAGLEAPNFLDYGGMAGLKFAARSPAKVRAAEDELARLAG